MPASTYTLLELINAASFRSGAFTQKLTTLANADLMIENMVIAANEILRVITRHKPAPSLWANGVFETQDDYQTGTVTMTSGSTTVTGASTVWTQAMVGSAFSIQTRSELYRIAAVTSATTLELDSAWTFETGAGLAYAIAQDRYSLPSDFFDFIENTVSLEGTTTRTLRIMTPAQIEMQRHRMRTRPMLIERPTMVGVFTKDSTGNWMVELDPFPDDVYRIPFRYRKVCPRLRNEAEVLPIEDGLFDVAVRGLAALWKRMLGQDGGEVEYARWEIEMSGPITAMDQRSFEQPLQLVPSDTMRNPPAPMGGGLVDWGSR